MKTIKKKFIKFILKQLPILQRDSIIDDETNRKIFQYYQNQLNYLKSDKKEQHKNLIIIILGIISSLLIAGGIILLIGYNWQYIPIELKSFLAFILLLIPQGIILYKFTFAQKEPGIAFKEGMGLFWALIFGGVVAFIGQIYRLPTNMSLFFCLWACSTLAIVYIYNSYSAIALYLILLIAMASAFQLKQTIGLLFYPLFLLLIPLYRQEIRQNNPVKTAILQYFLLAAIISGLGITLEKAVPGLWIVIYANLFTGIYLINAMYEKSSSASIFYSPLKIASALGLFILSFLLIGQWAWKNIGWLNYRGGGRFNAIASIFDYTIAFITVSTNTGLIIYLWSKQAIKKDLPAVIAGAGILITLIYLAVSIKLIQPYLASWLIVFYIICAVFYLLYSRISINKHYSLIAFILLFVIPVLVKFIISSKREYSGFWVVFLADLFVFYYFFGRLYETLSKRMIFRPFKLIGIIGLCILAFILSWKEIIQEVLERNKSIWDSSQIIILICYLFFMAALLAVFYFIYKNKITINPIAALLPVILAILYIFQYTVSLAVSIWLMNLFVLLFCLYGFFLGFKEKSLLIINSSAIFLTITILVRFFDETYGLLARGLIFIFCGLIILLLNLFLTKMRKNDVKPKA